MKLVITGGRNQHLTAENLAQLDTIENVTELVSGHASGVDQDAEKWAKNNNIPVKIFLPNWQRYGRAAGPIRNREMAAYADVLVAFSGGAGTQNMLSEAKKVGIIIHQFDIQKTHQRRG